MRAVDWLYAAALAFVGCLAWDWFFHGRFP